MGCQLLTFNNSKIVKIQVVIKGIMNFKRDTLLFDRRIGPNNSTNPIKTPMQAVKHQDRSPVYIAQVNKSRQIERKLESVNASSFRDSIKDVMVGMNV